MITVWKLPQREAAAAQGGKRVASEPSKCAKESRIAAGSTTRIGSISSKQMQGNGLELLSIVV
jgi:hypothetical protein